MTMVRKRALMFTLLALCTVTPSPVFLGAQATDEQPALIGPLDPQEALASFELYPGLQIELIACEPDVVDPTVACWDARGRMYVLEYRDYPLGPEQGEPPLGRIKLLEDTDGDGLPDTCATFAHGLSFATGIAPFREGLLVTCPPDVVYLQDSDGDNAADLGRVLFTGLHESNPQHRANVLNYSVDNWIYMPGDHSDITLRRVFGRPMELHEGDAQPLIGSAGPPKLDQAPPVHIGSRDIRFRPHASPSPLVGEGRGGGTPSPLVGEGRSGGTPSPLVGEGRSGGTPSPLVGEGRGGGGGDEDVWEPWQVEAAGGWSQFGMGIDDWGRRFTNANSDHIRHVVLEARYADRNEFLDAGDLMARISDHDQAGRVFQISNPQERFNDFDRLLHVTSCCGTTVLRGTALGEEWVGNVFCCEPVANLAHRDVLEPAGATFVARRGDDPRAHEHEFLASRDNWSRPVNFANGPDGALYVLDMYREHIEHPEWIPLSIQEQIDVRAGDDRGRIYRVAREGWRSPGWPNLAELSSRQLVAQLAHPDGWRRETAQRLLVERRDFDVVLALREMALGHESPLGRLHALGALEGMSALDDETILAALNDEHPGIVEHAVRLAEAWIPRTVTDVGRVSQLRARIVELAGDDDTRVRFQAGLSLGGLDGPDAVEALAGVAMRDGGDYWFRAAVFSASAGREDILLREIVERAHKRFAGRPEVYAGLAELIALRSDPAEAVSRVLAAAAEQARRDAAASVELLDGLAAGLQRRGGGSLDIGLGRATLIVLMEGRDESVSRAARRVASHVVLDGAEADELIGQALATACDPEAEPAERVEAIAIASRGRPEIVEHELAALLVPQQPPEVQQAAARGLIEIDAEGALPILIDGWPSHSPALRATIIDLAISRSALRPPLLEAVEADQIAASDFSLQQRTVLLTDPELASRAEELLAVEGAADDREAVLEEYADVLELTGDGPRGWQLFREHCAACHRLENVGREVGPDLAGVREQPRETLLDHILNPSHNIEPRFRVYLVETTDGIVVTGILASESAGSVTLVDAEGQEHPVLRRDIEQMIGTDVSIMPEGLERELSRQEIADLIAFLRGE